MLGKIENHRALAKMKNVATLAAFLQGVLPYLHKDGLGVAYPTHRTADEKRIKRNTQARKRRAATKEST